MNGFHITYERYSFAADEDEAVEDSGFLHEDLSFRDAIEALRWDRGCYVESDCYPVNEPRWFTFYETERDLVSGDYVNKALHLPKHLTPSTRRRIARLIGCYGA